MASRASPAVLNERFFDFWLKVQRIGVIALWSPPRARTAILLASRGVKSMALAYFGMASLPLTLQKA